MFLRFSAAKNSKKRIPARNWRDPDAPTAIMTISHAIAIAIIILLLQIRLLLLFLLLLLLRTLKTQPEPDARSSIMTVTNTITINYYRYCSYFCAGIARSFEKSSKCAPGAHPVTRKCTDSLLRLKAVSVKLWSFL